MGNKGFTLVEGTTSMVILAIAVLGLGSTTARLTRVAAEAEVRGIVLEEVESRVALIRMYPVYQEIESVFSESEAEVPGLPGYTRSTLVRRVTKEGSIPGKFVDYTAVTVTVDGPGLADPISRSVAIGFP